MRIGSVFSAALAMGALALPAAAQAAITVNIDKTSQRMTVAVDGQTRYVWPVSTGRSGYDTPNGTFKVNRMDANHLSQEWDNAPMPHTMFFDMRGHAIHGFFDVKHLGLPVSHGCVRIAPSNATLLFNMVKQQGMAQTTVIVSGQTPARGGEAIARREAPGQDAQPQQLAPPGYDGYQPEPPQAYDGRDDRQPQPYYGQPPQPYDGQQPQQPYYAQQPQQPYYAQQPRPYYGGQAYYRQPPQPYYGQQPPSYGPPGAIPPQPPPPQYFGMRPPGQY